MKSSVKFQEILRGLECIPSDRLEDIEKLIKLILSESEQKKEKDKEPKTLHGIWANRGFEKIVDLEKEIQNSRVEIQDRILKRKL